MNQKKFVVSYEIDYVHRVSVGVTAENSNEAETKARAAFDEGSIWDDTDAMPLLYEEYEDSGEALRWMPVEEVGEFPARDRSVMRQRAQGQALAACKALVEAYRAGQEAGGSVEWEDLDQAHALAVEAIRWYDHPNRDAGAGNLSGTAGEGPLSPLETGESIGEPEAAATASRFEHMSVAGLNPKGEADILPVTVEVTEEQWALGEHLSVAEDLAGKAGWEGPFVVFSSDETANLRRASTHGVRKPRLAIREAEQAWCLERAGAYLTRGGIAMNLKHAIGFVEHVAALKLWGEPDTQGKPFEPSDGLEDSHACLMDLIEEARTILPPAHRPATSV